MSAAFSAWWKAARLPSEKSVGCQDAVNDGNRVVACFVHRSGASEAGHASYTCRWHPGTRRVCKDMGGERDVRAHMDEPVSKIVRSLPSSSEDDQAKSLSPSGAAAI